MGISTVKTKLINKVEARLQEHANPADDANFSAKFKAWVFEWAETTGGKNFLEFEQGVPIINKAGQINLSRFIQGRINRDTALQEAARDMLEPESDIPDMEVEIDLASRNASIATYFVEVLEKDTMDSLFFTEFTTSMQFT